MANQRILVSFLKAQAQVRTERVTTHRAMRNPNGQMIARFADEAKMLEQAADIVAQHDFSTVTQTSDEFQKELVAEQRAVEVAEADQKHAPDGRVTTKVSATGKRIGRPPKMTLAQIKAQKESPIGVAINDRDDSPAA